MAKVPWSLSRRKRCMDALLALGLLLLLLPVYAAVALLVRFMLGSPVLFRQLRPGWRGQPFVMMKFRSMREGQGSDAERLGRFGRWLRRSSLDELPELWHILRGEMSFVGPRPLLMEYVPRYSPEQARRHEVRPGLTGWAQIHGRNHLSWEEKFALDVWYVDHASFRLDCLILWRTLLRPGGAGADPAEPFLGT